MHQEFGYPELNEPSGGTPPMIEPPRMARSPTVLVVNEEEWLARSIEAVLVEHGYVVRRRASAREALELLASERPDAVIIDRRLPDSGGAALCRQLREDPRVGQTVPIAVTSMVSLSAGERAEFFRAGAWDLWGPLLEPQVFAIKLDTFVSAKLAGELRSSEDLDPATGLLSSRTLSRRADEIGAVIRRVGGPLACVAIASATGNGSVARSTAATDSAMRHLTNLWRPRGRAADCVGRFSDSELGVVAPGSDSAGAVGMFRRLQELLVAAPTNGQEQPAPIRAGYCASANLMESHVSVPEMLRRAALAVRYATLQHAGADIVSYDDVPQEARN